MAQINLLKQTNSGQNIWEVLPKFAARLLIAILAILVIYYIYLYFESKNIDNKISTIISQINQDRQTALTNKDRPELLTRQQQLSLLDGLISKHLYWSQLMPKLAQVTYNKASYSSLKVSNDGTLTLSVNLPSVEDLDLYLQVFDLPQINKYFSNVRIGSFHKVQSDTVSGVTAQIQMNFNPSIIQYGAVSGQ